MVPQVREATTLLLNGVLETTTDFPEPIFGVQRIVNDCHHRAHKKLVEISTSRP